MTAGRAMRSNPWGGHGRSLRCLLIGWTHRAGVPHRLRPPRIDYKAKAATRQRIVRQFTHREQHDAVTWRATDRLARGVPIVGLTDAGFGFSHQTSLRFLVLGIPTIVTKRASADGRLLPSPARRFTMRETLIGRDRHNDQPHRIHSCCLGITAGPAGRRCTDHRRDGRGARPPTLCAREARQHRRRRRTGRYHGRRLASPLPCPSSGR
jgi:hypothetical protein